MFVPDTPISPAAFSATEPPLMAISSVATSLVMLPRACTWSVPLFRSVRVPSKSTFPPRTLRL